MGVLTQLPGYGAVVLSLVLLLASLVISLYLTIRIGWWAVVYSWVTDLREYPPIGGADLEMRPADREEIRARRLLQRGRITRFEYERMIAYRRYAHGEITESDYRAIMKQMDSAAYGPRRT